MRERVPHTTIVDLLALTLGDERARVTWAEALRGVAAAEATDYDGQQTAALLTALGLASGTIGLAARVAKLRLESEATGPFTLESLRAAAPPATAPQRAEPRHEPVPPSHGSPGDQARLAKEVLSFLSPSLGDEKARDVLGQYAKTLGISLTSLTRVEAIVLLDAMSQASGLLGVVARFAKVRFEVKRSVGP
jgi:hypothetical protein